MRRSTGRFYGFCAVVFALGLAASGYLNYYQYQRAQERIQVDNDALAQAKREATLNAPVAAGVPAPAVLGARVINITELGIALTVINPLSDLSYQFQQENGLDGVNLTSTSLINTTTSCGPGSLGRLVRQSVDARPTLATNNLIKQLGNYNFYYEPNKVSCAKDPVSTSALKADIAVMPAILGSLTTAQ
jgi:hypothetical protein